jgi:organic radical activating enzyme
MLERLLDMLASRQSPATAASPDESFVPNPGVRIRDGLIRPNYACQSEIVRHCNMSCADCNHLSPLVKKAIVEPEDLFRDYSLLAKVYRPELIYLTGGEPLLHPDIPGVVQAVKESGISSRVRILTNGVLLSRMTNAFWQAIDDLEVSIYPSSKLQAEEVSEWNGKAERFGVHLEVFRFGEFRRSFSLEPYQDQALLKRVFDACKQAHVWGCHYVDSGYIYRCPQSVFLPRMLELPESQHSRDGLKLRQGDDFQQELYQFLTASTPLEACRNCLGTAGVLRKHTEVRRADWKAHQEGIIESLVDFEELSSIEADMNNRRRDHIKDYVEMESKN